MEPISSSDAQNGWIHDLSKQIPDDSWKHFSWTIRKARLFACACCRRPVVYADGEKLRALEAAEAFADGRLSQKQIQLTRGAMTRLGTGDGATLALWYATKSARLEKHALETAKEVALKVPEAMCMAAVASARTQQDRNNRRRREQSQIVDLFRDVFPFVGRTVAISPSLRSWQDGTIPSLAQAAYEERELPSGHLDAQRLAVLADALEEAGCADEDMLAHLRGPGPHVRGCWVVDLLLAKK